MPTIPGSITPIRDSMSVGVIFDRAQTYDGAN
jgi:hypothetical protein